MDMSHRNISIGGDRSSESRHVDPNATFPRHTSVSHPLAEWHHAKRVITQPVFMKSIKSSPKPVDEPPPRLSSFFLASKACSPLCLRALALLLLLALVKLLALLKGDVRGPTPGSAGKFVAIGFLEAVAVIFEDRGFAGSLPGALVGAGSGCRDTRLQIRHSLHTAFEPAFSFCFGDFLLRLRVVLPLSRYVRLVQPGIMRLPQAPQAPLF